MLPVPLERAFFCIKKGESAIAFLEAEYTGPALLCQDGKRRHDAKYPFEFIRNGGTTLIGESGSP
jgi:hypothetical protein